jgi:hypothetical protein
MIDTPLGASDVIIGRKNKNNVAIWPQAFDTCLSRRTPDLYVPKIQLTLTKE